METTDKRIAFVWEEINRLVPQFESLAELRAAKVLTPSQTGKGRGKVKGWQTLAAETFARLKVEYPDTIDEKTGLPKGTYRTAVRYAEDIKRVLRDTKNWKPLLKDEALRKYVSYMITNYCTSLTMIVAPFKAESNVRTREKADERKTGASRIAIDPSEALSCAKEVLMNAKHELENPEDPNKKEIKWEDVSIALALTTGRRMVEIHQSGVFMLLGDSQDQLVFSGQAKGKNRIVYVDENNVYIKEVKGKANPKEAAVPAQEADFIIEALVDPELIVSGLDWLEEKGKRIDPQDHSSKVNAKFSMLLSRRLAKFSKWDFILEHTDDEATKLTYHKFRGCYLRLALEQFLKREPDTDVFDIESLIAKLLCDGEGEVVDYYKRYQLVKGN